MIEDTLKRENERLWQQIDAFNVALIDLPEVPPVLVLDMLSDAGARGHLCNPPQDFRSMGKALQREHGLDAIPPRSEYEAGAGVWHHIRSRLIAPD